MTATDPTVPAACTRAELGQLGEALARESGESIGIHRLTGEFAARGLLFKEYKKTAVRNGREAALDKLIEFGRSSAPVGRAEREVLLRATSWPVAKVTDENEALIGCLIQEANQKFRSGNGKPREIDLLALPVERLEARGISVTPEQRLAVCRAVVEVAAALERRGLVYSDWNYANALWCPSDCSVFVIDIDGCCSERMSNIFQSGWEDSLTTVSEPADIFTDRYRVALLTARCLTGQRNLSAVLHTLDDAEQNAIIVRSILLDMLWAADRTQRPTSRNLLAALDGAGVRFPVDRRPLPPRQVPPARKPTPTVKATAVTIIASQPAESKPPTRTGAMPPAQPGSAAKGILIVLAVVATMIMIFMFAAIANR